MVIAARLGLTATDTLPVALVMVTAAEPDLVLSATETATTAPDAPLVTGPLPR